MRILGKNIKFRQEIPIESYEEYLEKIKTLINTNNTGNLYTYKEIGEKLGITDKTAHSIIGKRFQELVKNIPKEIMVTGEINPEIILLGDGIQEISTNMYYKSYKQTIIKQGKLVKKIRRI